MQLFYAHMQSFRVGMCSQFSSRKIRCVQKKPFLLKGVFVNLITKESIREAMKKTKQNCLQSQITLNTFFLRLMNSNDTIAPTEAPLTFSILLCYSKGNWPCLHRDQLSHPSEASSQCWKPSASNSCLCLSCPWCRGKSWTKQGTCVERSSINPSLQWQKILSAAPARLG